MSDGETVSTSAILSKPLLSSSGGSSAVASISSASRSRMALAYSARLRRCSAVRPGCGLTAAARSIVVSRCATNASSVAASGRGIPAGGIIPARTFRITFSHISAWLGMSLRSACSSDSSPDRVRSLWHVTQYVLTRAAWDAGEAAAGVVVPCADPVGPARTAASTRVTAAAQRAVRKVIEKCTRDHQQSSGLPALQVADDVAGGALDAKGHFTPIRQRQRQGVHTSQDSGLGDAGDIDMTVNGRRRPGLAAGGREVVVDPEGEPVPCGAKREVLRADGTDTRHGVEEAFGHGSSRPRILPSDRPVPVLGIAVTGTLLDNQFDRRPPAVVEDLFHAHQESGARGDAPPSDAPRARNQPGDEEPDDGKKNGTG